MFFVASEFSFVKVRSSKMKLLEKEGNKRATKVLFISKHLDDALSSTQLGISLASIGIGFVAEALFTSFLLSFLGIFGITEKSIPSLAGIGFVTGYVLGTYFHVVLGELFPKSIAIRKAEATALWLSSPMYWFMKVSTYPMHFLNWSAEHVLRLFNIQPISEFHGNVFGEEELKLIIQQSLRGGELEEYESRLIYRIFQFTDTPVKSLITPRHAIKALSSTATLDEVITLAKETGYSRFPIYQDKLDSIIGFVHIKDAIAKLDEKTNGSKNLVSGYLRPVITVHENHPVDDLLQEMQKQRTQVSVVVDEWGSVAGIITIEDILEAIVGPIRDEFDYYEDGSLISKSKNGLIVLPKITIAEFNEYLQNLRPNVFLREEGDAVTLAGYLLDLIDSKIPNEGDTLSDSTFDYKILKMNGNRIEKVLVLDHGSDKFDYSVQKSEEELMDQL